MNISVLLPSRGRPKMLKKMFMRSLSLARSPEDIEWIVYIDNDDIDTICAYEDMQRGEFGNQIKAVIGDRLEYLTWFHDECYKISSADICMLSADDIEFRTQNWDELILDEFDKYDDKVLLVHGNDDHKKDDIAVTCFLHRNWIETLGYLNPPFFKVGEGDKWLTELANEIDRRIYLPDVKFVHLFRETEDDEVNKHRKKSRHKMKRLYRSEEMKKRRLNDIGKLKNCINVFNGDNDGS